MAPKSGCVRSSNSHHRLVWGQNSNSPNNQILIHEQVNFQFSPYIAEMANTFSNIFTISLALCGGSQAMKERLPPRFPLGYAVRLYRSCLLSLLKLFHPINPNCMHLPEITGHRSSWPRQFFLSCNPPLRSSTCRRAPHDLRRVYESISRLWQQTGFWVTFDAFQSAYCAFSIIWRSFYLELVSVLSFVRYVSINLIICVLFNLDIAFYSILPHFTHDTSIVAWFTATQYTTKLSSRL